MSTPTIMKLTCIALVCLAMTAQAEISCRLMAEILAPCLGFLERGQGPSLSCCQGVSNLKNMVVSTSDRRTACQCVKVAAAAIPAIKPEFSAVLPDKCGVSIPVDVGPQADCSKIN